MKLTTKTTVFTIALSSALLVVLLIISLYAFRQFSLSNAEEHARTAAEIVRVSLTEAMVNGVITERERMLQRLSAVEGLRDARVVRGQPVVKQFGDGLTQERDLDKIEKDVLSHGKAQTYLNEEGEEPVFRMTIPYIATQESNPNCLACHDVKPGAVLGAVTISISLGSQKTQALITVSAMIMALGLFAGVTILLVRGQIRAIVTTAEGVSNVVSQAKGGDFTARIELKSEREDEIGTIAKDLNDMMMHLQESLGDLTRDVARVIQYESTGHKNILDTTTHMVDTLVNVAHFKQTIEEDRTPIEVYQHIGNVLRDEFLIQRYSIYEVLTEKDQLETMVVDGELKAGCRWCDLQILAQAEACRARRSAGGRVVDAVDTPGLCNMFSPSKEVDGDWTHMCIPILHSGTISVVVQLVVERSHAQFFRHQLPFIQVYLREAAPVIQAKRLLDTLRDSALRDAMTGLHNRRFLEEYLDTMLATAKRQGNSIRIMMLDLDHFKGVNDTYGHDAGDAVLIGFGKVATAQVRASDMVIRYGGEEFMVLITENSEDKDGAGDVVAEKIRAAVEAMRTPVGGHVLSNTVSVGLSSFPEDGDDFWEVAKLADVALYQAKRTGRNRVVNYVMGMESEEESKGPAKGPVPRGVEVVNEEVAE
ncbi:diguanylate cyclase [Magnetococcus sp. PR-3]|uniref:diguanylate cyclase n=1 Tax=Magnetococcus sp. PR-3 TaxID=3120355 RepID=UPI002FCDE2A5